MRRSIDKQTRGNNIHFNYSPLQKPERSVSRTDSIAKLNTNYTDSIILEQMWASWRRDEPHNSDPKHSTNVTWTFKIHLDSFSICLFPTHWPSTIAMYSSYCDHKHEMRTGEVQVHMYKSIHIHVYTTSSMPTFYQINVNSKSKNSINLDAKKFEFQAIQSTRSVPYHLQWTVQGKLSWVEELGNGLNRNVSDLRRQDVSMHHLRAFISVSVDGSWSQGDCKHTKETSTM